MTTWNWISRYAAILLFAGLGVQGLWGGIAQADDSETLGQQVQTGLQCTFGLFGMAAGACLFLRGAVPHAIEWGWTLTLAFAGGVAAVAWGETTITIGVIGGVATALVALFIVWLGRWGRTPTSE